VTHIGLHHTKSILPYFVIPSTFSPQASSPLERYGQNKLFTPCYQSSFFSLSARGPTRRHNSTGLAELWGGWPIELDTLEFGIGVTSKTSKHYIGNRHYYSYNCVFYVLPRVNVKDYSPRSLCCTQWPRERREGMKIFGITDLGVEVMRWKRNEQSHTTTTATWRVATIFSAIGLAVLWARTTCT
jgi:hypothetical protein